jgi:hypothetical protein
MSTTVFISSTSRDLPNHRAAVAGALLNAGFHPIDMANFMARPEEATSACLKEVADSDLFVGIYAWRYGFIPPGAAVSITEQEFDEAERLGKPRFCFVVDESYDWPAESREQEEGARLLREFKARIDATLVRTTFTTPEDLAIRVLASLQRWVQEKVGAEEPQAEIPPLPDESTVRNWITSCAGMTKQEVLLYAQYNPDIYTPRDQEGLLNEFLQSAKTCLPVVGNSGMGKSVLLHRWATTYIEQGGCCVVLRANGLQGDTQALDRAITAYLAPELSQSDTDGLWLPACMQYVVGVLERPFLVFIDGLNENPDPKALLAAINQLMLECQAAKIRFVLSCRTETWRSIWVSLRLDRKLPVSLYFGFESACSIATGIAATTAVGPYTDRELEDAYRRLNLRPGWEQLQQTRQAKEWLRDPLMLWIVAEIYSAQDSGQIPVDLPSHQIMAKYLSYVATQTGTPNEADKALVLIAELMSQRKKNAISANDLRPAGILADAPDNVISKFVDMGVLERVQQPSSRGTPAEDLRFSKDRLLEFLLYRRLSSTRSIDELECNALLDLIEESYGFVYVWGALQYWMSEAWPADLLTQLSRHSSVAGRNFLVSLCQIQSHEFKDRIHDFLKSSLDAGTPESKRFAVAAAYADQDLDILENALVDKDDTIQLLATEYTEYLYESGSERVIILLNRLGQKVRKGVLGAIRSFDYIGAMIYLTVLLAPKYIDDADSVNQIVQAWTALLQQIVPKAIYGMGGKRLVRDLLVELGAQAAIRAIGKNEGGWLDGVAAKEFYEMPLEFRQRVSRLAPYTGGVALDAAGTELLFDLSQVDNGIVFSIARLTLACQGFLHWDETMALVTRMFCEGNAISRGCVVAGLGMCVQMKRWVSADKLEFYIDLVSSSTRHPPYGRMDFNGRDKPGWITYYLGMAIHRLDCLQGGQADNLLLDYLQETLWDATDSNYFSEVADNLALLAVDTDLYFVLEILRGLYGEIRHSLDQRASIYRIITRALSQLYMRHSTEIDGFITALGEMGPKSSNQIMMDLRKEEQGIYAANLFSSRCEYFCVAVLYNYPNVRQTLFTSMIESYPVLDGALAAMRQLLNDILKMVEGLLSSQPA